jgi:predicted nuclease with TOPRIM domain
MPPSMEVVRSIEPDASELLERLERQAAESGRLEGHVQTLESAVRREREARRRLADTLKRERKAAEALHTRAEHAEAVSTAQAEELERLREAVGLAEQQLQAMWAQLSDAERRLATGSRPFWRKLLRRPPAG